MEDVFLSTAYDREIRQFIRNTNYATGHATELWYLYSQQDKDISLLF